VGTGRSCDHARRGSGSRVGRGCQEARLSSSLSSKLSSADGAKHQDSDRFLTPGDPELTIACVDGGDAIT
jgi:hypothetical protein